MKLCKCKSKDDKEEDELGNGQNAPGQEELENVRNFMQRQIFQEFD